jgi:hypothetical protein
VAIATPPGTARVLTIFRAEPWRADHARSVVLSLWWWRLGAVLLILGSAWPAPLGTISGLTITGDRILGLTALAALAALAVAGRLHWTGVHTVLALFVGAQALTTAFNAPTWTQGPKFVTVYLLGFACFALAAECARGLDGRRWLTGAWIGVAAALSLVGTVSAVLSNVYQQPFWGSGGAQPLFPDTGYERILYGARATFNEWNLFSSFLLIAFSVALWAWRRDAACHWRLAVLVAMVFGLVNGITRATWLSMLAIVALWGWKRRPRSRQAVVFSALLVGMLGAALLVQAYSLGAMPIRARLFEQPSNITHRMVINRVTVDSWLERPVSEPEARYSAAERVVSGTPGFLGTVRNVVLGHGAGSVNRLSIVFPVAGRVYRIWNGNVVLFMLHDSGVLGLAALLGVVAVIVWQARRVITRGADEETSLLIVPLLASGAALCFAYQFTHGLWLMYPYVYLGLLTAVLEARDAGGRLAADAFHHR